MITLPGLIDPHVHFRTPGQTEKEDFYTGTCAALAGGYTTVLDMPNNTVPITSIKLLEEKIEIAKKQTVCDLGFHFGSLGDNLDEFKKVKDLVFGLKLYLNSTTGNFIIDDTLFEKIANAWPKNLPILAHAEENILEKSLFRAHQTNTRIHVCHISTAKELQLVIDAKQKGYSITCGVTPHHLFLTEKDAQKLGPLGKVKPFLKPQKDVDFLWKHLDSIDLIESDHAPHTKEEKEQSTLYGFPGLETTLPLLLTAVSQNKLTIDDIIRLCHDNPSKIFGIQSDPTTYIEIDENEEWTIKNENLKTKSGWSPFNGWEMKGKVKKVIIRGTKVYENNTIFAAPGSGKILI